MSDTMPSGSVFTESFAPQEPTFDDIEAARIRHFYDVAEDLQHNLADYKVLTPCLPFDEEQLALDALRQAEIAEEEGAKVMVETMKELIHDILVRNKLIL